MSEQELVLSVQHVTSGYRAGGVFRKGPYQEVLHDVTFDVRHGEILGLVGESGTGKSGYILIGDKVFDHEARFRYLYDLSDEWRAMTGLPFAFAAWVARGEVPQERVSQLEEALRYGTAHIPEAVAWSGYAARPYACDYLIRNIDFVLDAPKRRAMELYWQLGRRYDPPSTPG